jgi:hypothetical protein
VSHNKYAFVYTQGYLSLANAAALKDLLLKARRELEQVKEPLSKLPQALSRFLTFAENHDQMLIGVHRHSRI